MSEIKVMAEVPENSPLRVAWEKYKAGEDYKNSFKWAEYEQHRSGSMWAAFVAGFEAALPPPPEQESE